MTAPPIPKNLTDTVAELLENGWSFAVEQTTDGVNPFIRLQARKPDSDEKIVATWHSRETGGQRYRWRSALRGNTHIPTLAKLRDLIVGEVK